MKTKRINEIITFQTSLNELSPQEVASLITYLLKHEQRTGGPYELASSVSANVKLNARIYILFKKAGKELKNVREYAENSFSLLSKEEQNDFTKALIDSRSKTEQPTGTHPVLEQVIPTLPPLLQPIAIKLGNKLAIVDKNGELTQLSQLFVNSTSQQMNSIAKEQLLLFGSANFYTWMAYSLYDRVLDDNDEPVALPLANIFHRLAYQSYVDAGIAQKSVDTLFQEVDSANAEEVAYCRCKVENNEITITRLPETMLLKKLLGMRSIVHCLGPLQIIKLQNTYIEFPVKIKQIFLDYCAARQLNDDIHDWEEDLTSGKITYATAWLLRLGAIAPGVYKLDTLIPSLQKV